MASHSVLFLIWAGPRSIFWHIDLSPAVEMMELAIAAEFAMMTHVGLFTLTGDRYQFARYPTKSQQLRS